MATLKKHGGAVATFQYIMYRKCYCADGTVMKDTGLGWKITGKLKPGIKPADAAKRRRESMEKQANDRPAFALYRKEILRYRLEERRRIEQVFDTLGDDWDGAYIELNDHWPRVTISIDEVVELGRLRQKSIEEQGGALHQPEEATT